MGVRGLLLQGTYAAWEAEEIYIYIYVYIECINMYLHYIYTHTHAFVGK